MSGEDKAKVEEQLGSLEAAKSFFESFEFIHSLPGALREAFGPESDIDVLVEFEPDRIPGLLGIAGMELELSELFTGRKVDMRTPEDLSPYFRQDVLATAEVQYDRT